MDRQMILCFDISCPVFDILYCFALFYRNILFFSILFANKRRLKKKRHKLVYTACLRIFEPNIEGKKIRYFDIKGKLKL